MSSAQQENLSAQLAILFKNACLAELEALKPGNVHIFADGHGMVVQDFIKSAEAASSVIAQQNLSVGERILRSVEATWKAVNCNTNLGIILLCAPIIQAVLNPSKDTLRNRIAYELQALTVADAAYCYQAIALANPAGLGSLAQHDVQNLASISLLDAMKIAAPRDRIAAQYHTSFADILMLGLPVYQAALDRWQRPAWAITAVYLSYLAKWPDTHIVRKYGENLAIEIQKEASQHDYLFQKHDNPKLYMPELLAFDTSLKERKINPGTSADLTVATLLINSVINR